jgi:hypothetical protein
MTPLYEEASGFFQNVGIGGVQENACGAPIALGIHRGVSAASSLIDVSTAWRYRLSLVRHSCRSST